MAPSEVKLHGVLPFSEMKAVGVRCGDRQPRVANRYTELRSDAYGKPAGTILYNFLWVTPLIKLCLAKGAHAFFWVKTSRFQRL